MDHRSLIRGGVFGFLCIATAACSQKEKVAATQPRTYFSAQVNPAKTLELTEHYLEWQRGFEFVIRDKNRGLFVTDWTMISPIERYRVTVKATKDSQGSLISSHAERQVLENQNWIDLPSDGHLESLLLSELQAYLRTHENQRQ